MCTSSLVTWYTCLHTVPIGGVPAEPMPHASVTHAHMRLARTWFRSTSTPSNHGRSSFCMSTAACVRPYKSKALSVALLEPYGLQTHAAWHSRADDWSTPGTDTPVR